MALETPIKTIKELVIIAAKPEITYAKNALRYMISHHISVFLSVLMELSKNTMN